MNELNPFVDKFVLIESTHTFTGAPKRLYYDEAKDTESFAPFRDKIIHHVFDAIPNADGWHNERAQRNSLDKVLIDCNAQPDDIIIFTDIDEIINPDVFPVIERTYIPSKLLMKLYYYYFNCLSSQSWAWPAFCRYQHYITGDALRNATYYEGGKDYHKIAVLNAGWHFSYLMSAEMIADKLDTFLHDSTVSRYYDKEPHKNIEKIQSCIDTHQDLFGRNDHSYYIEPLDAPKYIMNNIEKYRPFIAENYELSRTDVINNLIRKNKLSRYLEIGVADAVANFDRIRCDYKAGIDPNVDCKYRMTSDDFFRNYQGERFDLIFADGLHTAEQTLRDINNALNFITENGFVVVHDCNPASEEMQWPIERLSPDAFWHPGWCKITWCGDVWKAFAKLRATRPELGMYVVDIDFGVGVINKSSQKLFTKKIVPEYEFLEENRKKLLNLREPERCEVMR